MSGKFRINQSIEEISKGSILNKVQEQMSELDKKKKLNI